MCGTDTIGLVEKAGILRWHSGLTCNTLVPMLYMGFSSERKNGEENELEHFVSRDRKDKRGSDWWWREAKDGRTGSP